MSYTREPLSGSIHGRGVKVAATSTPGTTIHTGQASTTLTDVVTLSCYNSDTVTRTLVLEWGGTTAPDDNRKYDIPPGDTIPVVVDDIIRNSLVIKAFCATANVLVLFGFVNVEA